MELFGKEHVVGQLEKFVSTNRFPHALLILGDPGVGKKTLADYVAELLLCEQIYASKKETNPLTKPCGVCNACTKIEGNIHPDVFDVLLLCQGKYNIKTLRDIYTNMAKRPNDGDICIYIFANVDTMSELCQNSLLKQIEEPEDWVRFVFTASDTSKILPTVISRVTNVRVDFPVHECTVAALAKYGIKGESAEKLASRNGDNIGKCLEKINDYIKISTDDVAIHIAEHIALHDEYKTAVYFSKLDDREKMASCINKLIAIFSEAMIYARVGSEGTPLSKALTQKLSLQKLLKISITFCDFLAELENNPNIMLANMYYVSRIFMVDRDIAPYQLHY